MYTYVTNVPNIDTLTLSMYIQRENNITLHKRIPKFMLYTVRTKWVSTAGWNIYFCNFMV